MQEDKHTVTGAIDRKGEVEEESGVSKAAGSILDPPVALVMGSNSDRPVAEVSASILSELKIGYRMMIVSAHRTPEKLFKFAKNAESDRYKVIIAAAGGAAHLPGMIASLTNLPVLGIPVSITPLNGLDSMFSIAQMPKGTPVATFAISSPGASCPGAVNAAVFAAQILSLQDHNLKSRLNKWQSERSKQ